MKFALYMTGGGTGVIPALLDKGGASKYIVDIQVPYSCEAINQLLGAAPQKYCSEETAIMLANQAYNNCRSLVSGECIGIGVTASLRKTNEREGRDNCAYVCMVGDNGVLMYKELRFKQKSRKEQEDALAELLYDMVLRYVFMNQKYTTEILECFSGGSLFIPLTGNVPCGTIYSGSFNPFHYGHKAIIDYHNEQYGPVDLEISYINADKGEISFYELSERLQQDFGNVNGIWISSFPMFVDKQEYLTFSGTTPSFVMGSDTYNRIPDQDRKQLERVYVYPRYTDKLSVDLYKGHQLEVGFPQISISSTELRSR